MLDALGAPVDPSQLNDLTVAIANALSPLLGSAVDARADLSGGALHVAVWSDVVAPGTADDVARQTFLKTLSIRDVSSLFGVSIDTALIRTVVQRAFAGLPKFYRLSWPPTPVAPRDADLELASLDLGFATTPDPDNARSEVVRFRTTVEIVQSFLPLSSSILRVTVDDDVRAVEGSSALPTTTTIPEIWASYWDNPLAWFGTVLLNLLLSSGKVGEWLKKAGLSDLGGLGAIAVRLLPPHILKPASTKKFPLSYEAIRLTTNAIVIQGGLQDEVERTPSLIVTGPTEVRRLVLPADRDPLATLALSASYTAAVAEFTPTHYSWVLIGGRTRVVLGPDAPSFTAKFLVPKTWHYGSYFIAVVAWDDAGNRAHGHLFVDVKVDSPPPTRPFPPIPPQQIAP